MHFIIFVPDCPPSDLEQRAKVAGIAHLLDGHSVLPNMPGPQQQTGLMVGWQSPTSPRMNFEAVGQTWVQSVAKDEAGKPPYWVGFWNDKPPLENELRRNYTQPGILMQFGDIESSQSRWKLPTPKTVPREAMYNDNGSMRWEVVRRFSWLCDEAATLAEVYEDNAELNIRFKVFAKDPSVQIDWLLKLLQINYRITPEVASYLHLWVDAGDSLFDVYLATFGVFLQKSGG